MSCVLLADVGRAQDVQALGVGGHQAVLDAVVDHLDEVAGAVRSAVQVALLRRAAGLLAARRALDVADAGRQRGEDRVEMLHHVRLAADHHAVAALQPPHAAAGADIDVVDALGRQFLGAPDVVDVIRIAAVDEDVAGLEQRQRCRRSSCPRPRPAPSARPRAASRAWPRNPRATSLRSPCPATSSCTAFGDMSKTTHWWPFFDQPAHHVGAHAAQSDHSELHDAFPLVYFCRSCAVAADQRVGRAVVGERRLGRAFSSGMIRCASTLPSSTPH